MARTLKLLEATIRLGAAGIAVAWRQATERDLFDEDADATAVLNMVVELVEDESDGDHYIVDL